MWTENGCTDILAVPDAGAIKLLQDNFFERIDNHLEDNFDRWFSSSRPNSVERRRIMIKFIGETWKWFEENHGGRLGEESTLTKLAYKTGNLFKLDRDPIKQFQRAVFRGYDKKLADGSFISKSPWEDISMKSWRVQQVANRDKKKKRKLIGGAKSFDDRKKRTVAAMLQLDNDMGERKSEISPVFSSFLYNS